MSAEPQQSLEVKHRALCSLPAALLALKRRKSQQCFALKHKGQPDQAAFQRNEQPWKLLKSVENA